MSHSVLQNGSLTQAWPKNSWPLPAGLHVQKLFHAFNLGGFGNIRITTDRTI